jgi:putative nucleotidyltransferase with HDIG domain
VAGYCALLASAAGLDEAEVTVITRAALLHEIGKLGVPEEVLQKPDRLTPADREQIRRHVTLAAEMSRLLRDGEAVSTVIRSHREHWDGHGYPDGLAGERIPIGARILAIADAFDTLTMDRPWRSAFSAEEAIEILLLGAESQWDPRLVDLFVHKVKQVAAQDN